MKNFSKSDIRSKMAVLLRRRRACLAANLQYEMDCWADGFFNISRTNTEVASFEEAQTSRKVVRKTEDQLKMAQFRLTLEGSAVQVLEAEEVLKAELHANPELYYGNEPGFIFGLGNETDGQSAKRAPSYGASFQRETATLT